jgi:hypothetical protein
MELTTDSPDVEDPDSGAEERVDVTRGEHGSTRMTFPGHEGVDSSVDVYIPDDADAAITVMGFDYDDEEGSVQLKLFSDNADFSTRLSPEQAQELAEDLAYAAREVESSETEVADE